MRKIMRKDVVEKVEEAEKVKSIKGYFPALLLLEEAHILSQPYAIEHFYVHWKMFILALRFRVWKELIGQVPRLLLAIPGSLTGKAPKGNVGSTRMGIFEVRKDA